MAPGGQSGGLTKADMGKAKMRAQRIVYMPIERERKFLVLGDTWRSSVTETVSIRQGYVTSSAMNSVRVRATSVNTPDWITVAGVPYILRLRSGLRRPRTPVRGTDLSGVVGACPGGGHGG